MRWDESQLAAYQNRQSPMKESKHRNHKILVDGIRYDSKREFAKWCELQMMERAGLISQLQRQVPYELIPPVVLDGRRKPPVKYVADFVYFQHGEWVIEDCKNEYLRSDPVFRLKRHLMKHVLNLDIKLS